MTHKAEKVFLLLLLSMHAAIAEGASPARQAMDLGTALYRQQRYEEAIVEFRKATRLDPGLLLAWENLGRACQRAGRNAEAIEVWQTVLKVEPTRMELLNALGALQLSEGLLPEAAETLSRSLALDADQAEVRLRLAVARERAGALVEAEQEYRRLAQRHPADLNATVRLAEFFGRTGREGAGLDLLRDAQERLPGAAPVLQTHVARLHARLGDRAYSRHDYPNAAAAYTRAIRSDPAATQYPINLGWAHRQMGELAEATRIWKDVLAEEPQRGELYRHIADAELEAENLVEAAAFYSQAWTRAEKEPAVAYRLADIALRQDRLADAEVWFEELLALSDLDDGWPRRVAMLFSRNERTEDGVAFFGRRLRASRRPDETRRALSALHVSRASAHYRASEFEAAAGELEEALTLDPASPQALRDLGWVRWATEDWEGCLAVWTRYASAYPGQAEPHNLLTHYYLERGDNAAAIASAEASLRLAADQPRQRLKLAKALFRDGRFTEARDLAETLALEDRDDPAVQIFWADLLMQYHDFDRGREQWQHVLDMGFDSPRAPYYWVRSLYERGEYDQALREARRWLEERGPDPLLIRFLAQDAVVQGREDEAIRWYKRLTRSYPEMIGGWHELVRLQSRAGDLEDARASLGVARRHHPQDLDLAVARAQLARRAGRRDEAYAAFRTLGERHPDHSEIFHGRVQSAIEVGRTDEALAVLSASAAGRLEDHEARMLEARILFTGGRHDDAERVVAPLVDPPREAIYLPVLLYHGLGEHRRSASMPVAHFDSQMEALRRWGFNALTVRELRRMLDGGEPFPPRPILITFDDARLDSFRLGDPVLARHGLKATMFVPTGRVVDDHPFFADWETIVSYASNGRWDLQSHGHHAHDFITVDAAGKKGSFLVNRRWLDEEARLESAEEYLARLEEDHRKSRHEIERHMPGAELVGYAFPMSEAGQESAGNEPRARKANREVLARHFRFGFIQDGQGYSVLHRSTPALFLRRLAVPRSWDGSDLQRHLARAHPSAQALAQRGRMRYWAGRYGRARGDWERLQSAYPPLRGEATYYLAAISHQQGWHRAAERQLRAAEQLGSERLQRDPSLSHRISWANRSRLQPRIDSTGDSAGRETTAQRLDVRLAFLGPLELFFRGGRLVLREAGFGSLEGREFGAGAGLRGAGPWKLEGRLWQRTMDDGAAPSLSYLGRLGFESSRVALLVQGGREDVETLRARRQGLQADSVSFRSSFRLGPRVSLSTRTAIARFGDDNERRDGVARLLVEPVRAAGVGLGAAAGWSDTRFQTPLYYTPEELRWVRGIFAWRKRWGSGWFFDVDGGVGLAIDTLRGRRLTTHLSGRAEQVWGDRVHTFVEARYSSSPGYRGWGFGGALQIGF